MFKIDRLQSDLINNYQKVKRRVQDFFHQGQIEFMRVEQRRGRAENLVISKEVSHIGI